MAERPASLKFPTTRRAAASLALVSVISAIESQRNKQNKGPGESDFASQDMSGELQTVPARHGVATFVPRGRTIKIINTYGKQVVSTWAFGLHAPPTKGEDDEEIDEAEAEEIEEKVEELKREEAQTSSQGEKGDNKEEAKGVVEGESDKPKEDGPKMEESSKEETKESQGTSNNSDDPPEQAPETPDTGTASEKKGEKRTWASYLPSIPYRNKNTGANPKADAKAEKEKNEATSKAWSSYLPTGKGFSSYVPNVQLPDSQGVVSAFKQSHYRDPNKSYAEQLYDFSKTPVGAGSLAAATGSGTASSLYAAYSAYTKLNASRKSQPPMEYLSLPHTRASTHRLVPVVDDTLLTNLRNPIMTLVEDTSPGAHDTLTAACDASQYAALGVDKPEEHGSCAENLVLALKELNEKAGLKGTKAVGADITVNIAPTPLHLFMNAPIELDSSAQGEGAGAKGAIFKVTEPQGKKRSYVRFRAERDMVIVMSACPMDVGSQNGGKCMAANFMVEEADDKMERSTASLKKFSSNTKQTAPKKSDDSTEKDATESRGEDEAEFKSLNLRGGPKKPAAVKASAERRDSASDEPPESAPPEEEKKKEPKQDDSAQSDAPKPKKKPKKLERRGAGSNTPAKSESS